MGLFWKVVAIVALIPLLAGVFGIWWTFRADQLLNERWLEDDQRWNAEIIQRLDRVEAGQGETEETLLEGQAALGQTLTGAVFQMGVHQGQHLVCGGD